MIACCTSNTLFLLACYSPLLHTSYLYELQVNNFLFMENIFAKLLPLNICNSFSCQLINIIDYRYELCYFLLPDDRLPIRHHEESSLYLSEWLLPSLSFRDKFIVKDVRNLRVSHD